MSSSIFGHLEAALRGYLAEVTRSARTANQTAAANLARYELPRIADTLRAVLDEHEPDERGRCAACRSRLWWRSPAPCRAYLTAHLCLLDGEDDLHHPTGDVRVVTAADLRHQLITPG